MWQQHRGPWQSHGVQHPRPSRTHAALASSRQAVGLPAGDPSWPFPTLSSPLYPTGKGSGDGSVLITPSPVAPQIFLLVLFGDGRDGRLFPPSGILSGMIELKLHFASGVRRDTRASCDPGGRAQHHPRLAPALRWGWRRAGGCPWTSAVPGFQKPRAWCCPLDLAKSDGSGRSSDLLRFFFIVFQSKTGLISRAAACGAVVVSGVTLINDSARRLLEASAVTSARPHVISSEEERLREESSRGAAPRSKCDSATVS